MNLIARGPDGKILFITEEEHRKILKDRQKVIRWCDIENYETMRSSKTFRTSVKSGYDPFKRSNINGLIWDQYIKLGWP